LRDTGVVVSEKVGTANRFEAVLSRDNIVKDQLSRLMDRFGEEGVAPLMLALVENNQFTPVEIQAFKDMLDRLEEDS
jgi:predicted transcriptional regulator